LIEVRACDAGGAEIARAAYPIPHQFLTGTSD
jgi:hypothetical protein